MYNQYIILVVPCAGTARKFAVSSIQVVFSSRSRLQFPTFFPILSLTRKNRNSKRFLLNFVLDHINHSRDQTLMKVTPCASTDQELSGGMRFSYLPSPKFAPSLDSDPTTYFYIIIETVKYGYKFNNHTIIAIRIISNDKWETHVGKFFVYTYALSGRPISPILMEFYNGFFSNVWAALNHIQDNRVGFVHHRKK